MIRRQYTKQQTERQLNDLGALLLQRRAAGASQETRILSWLAPNDNELLSMVRDHATRFFRGDTFCRVLGDWERVAKCPIRSNLVWFEGPVPLGGGDLYTGLLKGILETSESNSWQELRVTHHPVNVAVARDPMEMAAQCDHFWQALESTLKPKANRKGKCPDQL